MTAIDKRDIPPHATRRGGRRSAAYSASKFSWPGTEDLVIAMLDDSRSAPGWRPVRAGVMRAMSERKPPRLDEP